MTKKIKLTEATLVRIVERVVVEQQTEKDKTDLQALFGELAKDPDNPELIAKIAELTKKLDLPLTNKGKTELGEYFK